MAEARMKYTDPDFRRNPKTNQWCAICQKDIKGTPKFYIHLVDGCMALHPNDNLPDNVEDYGIQPIGPDCAKRLGMEWVRLTGKNSS